LGIFVAWEHKAIARALLPAIANGQSLPDMPTKWDGTRFDVLRFDRTSPEAFASSAPAYFLAIQPTKWADNAVNQVADRSVEFFRIRKPRSATALINGNAS
jgi:hypothetical protein